ncbi:DUF4192 domain-containing protein [Streptomyces fractus]|uniref:DUF4192 domain-containing protein n=1 Tax=Streptomyces fractus TaxID=641806 RepID=UPI003CEB1504
MTTHPTPIKIRTTADVAELLLHFVGHYPENSILLGGITDLDDLTHGPVMTYPLPDNPDVWGDAADTLATDFLHTTAHADHDVLEVIVLILRDPRPDQAAKDTADALRGLGDHFIRAFTDLARIPVNTTMVLVDNRLWTYDGDISDGTDGEVILDPTNPDSLTAQLHSRGLPPLRRASDIAREFRPATTHADRYQHAIHAWESIAADWTATPLAAALARQGTLNIIEAARQDLAGPNPRLHDEAAARIICGLQDRKARDLALGHGADSDLHHLRTLWADLARRCVAPHTDKAPPLLTLLSWTAWRQGDRTTARIALTDALTINRDYRMAWLLLEAINTNAPAHALMNEFRREVARMTAHDTALTNDQ